MHVIDGHNLIGRLPGMSLREIDDEARLVELLQVYARVRRRQVRVFFDGAPPGQAGERRYGALRARFVPLGSTADDAIRAFLDGLGAGARNVTVVTSDRMVQANAHERRARVQPSEEFARELLAAQNAPGKTQSAAAGKKPAAEPELPAGEVKEMLDLFGIDPAEAEKPIVLSSGKPPRRKKDRRARRERGQGR